MTKLNGLVDFFDEYLKINEISDESWNGLQFEGKPEVNKIIFAVDAGIETFKMAVLEKADMVFVHHGHFWKTSNPSLKSWNKTRMKILDEHNISLYAAHLPLDRHPIIGNNAQLLKIIGAEVTGEFSLYHGKNIGWVGKLQKPASLTSLVDLLNKDLNTKSIKLAFGKEVIETVAVCSGGGGYSTFYEALNSGVDLYITGDSIEAYHSSKDAQFNVVFSGHHATEIVGVRALSRVVKNKFDIDTKFIDIPTGL